eukprot:12399939-Karenia_brevis.AAC.1
MPIIGSDSTDSGEADLQSTVPMHGNKRAHISPTKAIVPQLPAPFGGEEEVDKKAKLQSGVADAEGE